MKKIISFITATLILVLSFVFSASAESSPLKISVGSPNAVGAGVFEVPITVTENPGIISLRLEIKYDKTKVTLLEINDSGRLGDVYHSNDFSADKAYLYWSNPLIKSDMLYEGAVATLTFANTCEEPCEAKIELVCNTENNDCLNFHLDKVDTEISSVEVTLSGPDEGTEEESSRNALEHYKKEETDNENQPNKFIYIVSAVIMLITVVIVSVLLILRKKKKK